MVHHSNTRIKQMPFGIFAHVKQVLYPLRILVIDPGLQQIQPLTNPGFIREFQQA